MAYTALAKLIFKYPCMYGGVDATNHTDEYTSMNGTVYYYNRHQPFSIALGDGRASYKSVGGAYYSPGWGCWSRAIVNDNPQDISDHLNTAYVSDSYVNNIVTIRIAVTNSTSSPIQISAVTFVSDVTFYRYNTTAGTTSSVGCIMLYKNLTTPITVPANDSVFLDISLTDSGDIRSVNVVENR